MFSQKTALLVEFTELPQHVKDELVKWHLFGNDRILPLITNYHIGDGPQTPAHMLVPKNFTEMYQSLVDAGEYAGSFEEFLRGRALVTHYWLAGSGQSFTGIDDVFINICW